MSRRAPAAPNAASCLFLISRRHLIASSGAAAMTAVSVAEPTDAAIRVCRAWQGHAAEYRRLGILWGDIEGRLIHDHDWGQLSNRERAAFPEALELDAIRDRLDDVWDAGAKLLAELPKIPAASPRALEAKLSVALANVRRTENPEAHDLIASILRDYQAMSGLGVS